MDDASMKYQYAFHLLQGVVILVSVLVSTI